MAVNRDRRGISLLELIVGIFVSSILLVGLSGSVLVALRASDPEIGDFREQHSALDVQAQMIRELQDATTLISAVCSANTIEARVADRTGDGESELIRYSWSGTVGDPLVRTFNGAANTVVSNVHEFSLRYYDRPMSTTVVQGSEAMLVDQNSTNTGGSQDIDISASRWCGAAFRPTLADDAIGWQITRFELELDKRGPDNGLAIIRIYAADGSGRPFGLPVGQIVSCEGNYSGGWRSFTLADPVTFNASQSACLVIGSAMPTGHAAKVKYGKSSTSSPKSHWLESSNGGSSWTVATDKDLRLRLWGRSLTAGAASATRVYTGVDMILQVGPNASAAVSGTLPLMNRPLVGGS